MISKGILARAGFVIGQTLSSTLHRLKPNCTDKTRAPIGAYLHVVPGID